MKQFVFLGFLLVFAACSNKPQINTDPSQYLTTEKRDSLLYRVLPYLAKLPKGGTHETKFEPRFADYYRGLLSTFKWRALAPQEDGGYLFMVDRPAPSLFDKKVVIAGKLNFDAESLNITHYEEFFWMFKLKDPELSSRSAELFELLVKGESYEAFLPMNSEEEYIEFPDAHNRFDKTLRRWVFEAE